MKISRNSSKAFVSIFLLLFALIFFLLISNNPPHSLLDIPTIQAASTQKQSHFLNIERIILNSLERRQGKIQINQNVLNYLNNQDVEYYIENQVLNKTESANLLSLNSISKLIEYKPAKHITVRQYILTNGIDKQRSLGFKISTNNYYTTFSFPKNYNLIKVVYG